MPKLIPDPDNITAYNRFRQPSVLHTACMAASNSMFLYPDGYVMPCCHSKDYLLGKYPENSLHDIWFSAQRTALKEALHNYNFDLGCEGCFNTLCSKNYDSVSALRFDGFGQKLYPTNMEFQLHNNCNLECVMCSGAYSSSILKNRDGLPSLSMLYNEKFVDELEEFIPHLTHATFSGGESFMIKIYYDIWERIARLNPSCKVNVITNGSVMNQRIKDLLTLGSFTITISIDAFHKDTYEAIRKNADYNVLLENLNHFSEIRSSTNTQININLCPMPINWKYIPAFVEKCNQLRCGYNFPLVYLPHPHSLLSLSVEELGLIAKYLIEHEPKNFWQESNRKKYHGLIQTIKCWQSEMAETPINPSQNINYFIEQFNLQIDQVLVSIQDKKEYQLTQKRMSDLIISIGDKLDAEALCKNLLEKDSLLRMLEESAKRNDEQASEGLIYFFGKKNL